MRKEKKRSEDRQLLLMRWGFCFSTFSCCSVANLVVSCFIDLLRVLHKYSFRRWFGRQIKCSHSFFFVLFFFILVFRIRDDDEEREANKNWRQKRKDEQKKTAKTETTNVTKMVESKWERLNNVENANKKKKTEEKICNVKVVAIVSVENAKRWNISSDWNSRNKKLFCNSLKFRFGLRFAYSTLQPYFFLFLFCWFVFSSFAAFFAHRKFSRPTHSQTRITSTWHDANEDEEEVEK